MDTIVIVLIVVIILLLFFLYQAKTVSITTPTVMNLNTSVAAIPNANLTNPTSVAFSYEGWVYVNTWNNIATKTIYYAGSSTSPLFSLQLGTTAPTLSCTIMTSATNQERVLITDNFPIQKWVYVAISVDSSIMDCYLDGKLIKSKKLTNVAYYPGSYDINFGSFDAYLTKFNRNAYALNPQMAWTSYMKGNGYSATNSYKFNVAVTQNDQPLSSITF